MKQLDALRKLWWRIHTFWKYGYVHVHIITYQKEKRKGYDDNQRCIP